MPPKVNFQMDTKTKDLLKSMSGLLTVGELGYAAGIAADIIAKEAKLRAPISKKSRIVKGKVITPGGLRRGIVSKINKTMAQFGNKGAAYVGVNYKIAPHAHLVEYGARGGQMPAQPFIRPAIDSKTGEALAALEADLTKRIIKKLGGQ